MRTIAACFVLFLGLTASSSAQELTWRKDIQPIIAAKCGGCHGAGQPEFSEWMVQRENNKSLSPRMDTYAHFMNYVIWPATGAMMRRLDDGKDMFDEKKTGKRALAEGDINKSGNALVREENAVAFDPNAGWKTGEVLPQYYLSRSLAKGSAGDNKQVKGTWADGMWTVVWARPLKLANSDDKALQEGKTYNFAFAIHDDNVTSRGHHISFPITVGFGTKADIVVTRLK